MKEKKVMLMITVFVLSLSLVVCSKTDKEKSIGDSNNGNATSETFVLSKNSSGEQKTMDFIRGTTWTNVDGNIIIEFPSNSSSGRITIVGKESSSGGIDIDGDIVRIDGMTLGFSGKIDGNRIIATSFGYGWEEGDVFTKK